MVVVAMPEELSLVKEKENYIITGVGALNVIKALDKIDRNERIYNIGYAGSNVLPKGTIAHIGAVKAYHPNADFVEPEYHLSGDIPCYTAGDFVLATDIQDPCVFDMELAYILAMGFKNVEAYKIVSDNLNENEFEEFCKGENAKI